MPAGIKNIEIEQGSTFTLTITYKRSGAAVDLTLYSARMQVRETVDSDDKLVDIDDDLLGGIVLGGVAGTITITISATTTAALDFESAVYDLELEDAGGIVTRLLKGTVTLSKEVTR